MGNLPVRARIYAGSCYFLSLLALGWLLFTNQESLRTEDWLLGAGLAILAATCNLCSVTRPNSAGQLADDLIGAPLFAALLLLPSPVLALVIICTFLPDWYVRRRTWFKTLFNLAIYTLAALVARRSLAHLTGRSVLDALSTLIMVNPLSVLLVMVVFAGTHLLLLAGVLKLACGYSFRQSELFAQRTLLRATGQCCLGFAIASCWVIDPIYGLVAALPALLIFQALQVPQLQAEASTDPKTGLANMRHFRHVTTQHLEQAHRRGQSLSLLMCDLDYLRDINNTYGHHAGDIVLNGIADIIRRALRGHDCAARFGGEEFVILLIDTDRVDAYQLAECVRQDLEQARFDIGSQAAPIAATLSIGVATFPHDGATIEGLMRAADEAVYQAKWAGRNRVCVAGGTQSNHTDAGAGDNDSRVSVPQAVRYRSATTHGRTERR